LSGADNRELSFKKGDKIRVIAQEEDGWWSAELNGKLGYIPSTYVEVSAGFACSAYRVRVSSASQCLLCIWLSCVCS
jgi:hypothetical protein